MAQPCPYLWAVAGSEDVVGGVTGVLLPGVVDQPTGFDGLLFQGLVLINHVFIPVWGSQGLDEELLPTGLKVATKKNGLECEVLDQGSFYPKLQTLGIFLQRFKKQKLINSWVNGKIWGLSVEEKLG